MNNRLFQSLQAICFVIIRTITIQSNIAFHYYILTIKIHLTLHKLYILVYHFLRALHSTTKLISPTTKQSASLINQYSCQQYKKLDRKEDFFDNSSSPFEIGIHFKGSACIIFKQAIKPFLKKAKVKRKKLEPWNLTQNPNRNDN